MKKLLILIVLSLTMNSFGDDIVFMPGGYWCETSPDGYSVVMCGPYFSAEYAKNLANKQSEKYAMLNKIFTQIYANAKLGQTSIVLNQKEINKECEDFLRSKGFKVAHTGVVVSIIW